MNQSKLRLAERFRLVEPVFTLNGETRYECTLEPNEHTIKWKSLNPNATWVIKNPRKECIEDVMRQMPGCTLFYNKACPILDPVEDGQPVKYHKSALYLLSPVATMRYQTEPIRCETVIITCSVKCPQTGSQQTGFFLIRKQDKPEFYNFMSYPKPHEMPGESTVKMMCNKFNLRIYSSWLTNMGTVLIKRGFNSIINHRVVVESTVYHLHLRDHQVLRALDALEMPEMKPSFPLVANSFVNTMSNGSTVMLMLRSAFNDMRWVCDQVNYVHLEMLVRCFNKTIGHLPYIKDIDMKPFLHYANKELQVVGVNISF